MATSPARSARWRTRATIVLVALMAAPASASAWAGEGAHVAAPARRCDDPHPCSYVWEGADMGPFALAEVREVNVTSFDGTVLHGWIGFPELPPGVRRAPVALHSTIYLGACLPAARGCIPAPNDPAFWSQTPPAFVNRIWGVPPVRLVEHGYIAAFFEVRGTGGSEGCFELGGANERRDHEVLVRWLARQPWSNGRVGMGGNSYPGITSIEAAVEAPPALKTIVAAGIVSDFYTFFHSPQGVEYEKSALLVAATDVAVAFAPHLAARPLADVALLPARAGCPAFGATVETLKGGFAFERNADFWEPRAYFDDAHRVRASVLLAHGLQDLTGHIFQEDDAWAALTRAHVWQIAGQWGHGPPFSETPALTPEWVRENWPRILFDWLGYWLQGTGAEPPQRVDYQDDRAAWRTTSAWPPAEAREEVFYLDGTRLSPTPGADDRRFRAAPSPLQEHSSATTQNVPVPGAAWPWCTEPATASVIPPAGAPAARTAVVYTSAPFETESLLAGNPLASIELTSDGSAGIVQVALVRWPASASCTDPRSIGTTFSGGGADLRYHRGGYDAQAFPVGVPTPVRIDLWNAATRFAPGDRLLVVVSGPESFAQFSSTSPHAPEVTVHARLSHVVLPFVMGGLGA